MSALLFELLKLLPRELMRATSLRTNLFVLQRSAQLKLLFSSKKRQKAEAWASAFLPESASNSERRELVHAHVLNSILSGSMRHLLLVHDAAQNMDLLRVDGWNHVEQALDRGQGCVLLITHLGLPQLLRWYLQTSKHRVLNLVTMSLRLPPSDSWLGRYQNWVRRRYHKDDETTLGQGKQTLQYLKPAFHHLKSNGIVCIAGDVGSGSDQTSFTVRGSRVTIGVGGIALGLMTGAKVIPCFTLLGRDPVFQLQFQEPLNPGESTARDSRQTAMLTDYMGRIQQVIEAHPDNVIYPNYLSTRGGHRRSHKQADLPRQRQDTFPPNSKKSKPGQCLSHSSSDPASGGLGPPGEVVARIQNSNPPAESP